MLYADKEIAVQKKQFEMAASVIFVQNSQLLKQKEF